MVFEPEEVRVPTPKEKAEFAGRRALEIEESLLRAAPAFDVERFKREFLPALMRAYNREARIQKLPEAKREWFRVSPKPERAGVGGVLAKDFYRRNRGRLMPILFPGARPAEATKAYDLLLKKMEELPDVAVWAVPAGSTLGHELGHVTTYRREPELPSEALKHRKGRGSAVKSAINEAIASWRGFRTAWSAWKRFGIPRKAWGAWFGFPAYTAGMDAIQIDALMKALKRLDARYPGIYEQARKTLYEYDEYVTPVMHNIPGADWTREERKALQRFLKARGGRYRKTLPATPEERLRHMRRQPYVMAPGSQREVMAARDEWVAELGISGVFSEQGLASRITDLTRQARVDVRPLLSFAHRRLNTRMLAKDVLHVLLHIWRLSPVRGQPGFVLAVGSDTRGMLRQILIRPEAGIVRVITVDTRQRMQQPESEKRRMEQQERQWERWRSLSHDEEE